MNSKIIRLTLLLFTSSLFFSCSRSAAPAGTGNSVQQSQSGASVPAPPCIVYKTKADFSKNVPVDLSDDHSQVTSYPDVKDVYFKGEPAYPTILAEGYLLDNRGIGPHVAFLDYTYEEYSKLVKTPSAGELMKHVLSPDPLLEMYDCGNRTLYKEPETELNALIRGGKLHNQKRLK